METLMLQKAANNPAEGILPRVHDHSRTDSAAPVCQNSEHQPVDSDQDSHPPALICVSRAERRGGKDDADRGTPGECDELALQVTSEGCLLADTRADGK